MGNTAAKLLDETELGVGTVQEDDGRSIVKAFVTTTEGITKIKNKKKTWVFVENEALLWTAKHVGMFKSHSVILDSTGTPVAIIIIEKKGMTSATNFVCRPVPSFEGQEPLTDEELQKAGIKYDDASENVVLYKFAKFETTRKLTTANCTYGIVTGNEVVKDLYRGEKLSSVGFRAIFKEAGPSELVIAKAYMPGMSMSPHLDVASGVDMLAVVSMGYALSGDESSAGALAGAGVI